MIKDLMGHLPGVGVLTLTLTLIWGLAGCGPGWGEGRPGPVLPPVDLELETELEVYDRYEPVRLTLTVTNRSRNPVTLRFPTSQRYDFRVRDSEGALLWRWSDGRAFAQVSGEEVLDAGDTLTWSGTFEGTLGPGTYTGLGSLPSPLDGLRAEATFRVR
jgi:hypothetical protein